MDVTVGVTRTLASSTTATVNADVSSTISGTGCNLIAVISHFLLLDEESSVASTTEVCTAYGIGESWTGSDLTGVDHAVHWLCAIRACCCCIIATAGCKGISGMDVTVGATRTLASSTTATVNADVSSTISGTGCNLIASISHFLSLDEESSVASTTEVCTACGIGESWTGIDLTGVDHAVHWLCAIWTGCCCIIATAGCNWTRTTVQAVGRTRTLSTGVATTPDVEISFVSGTRTLTPPESPCFRTDEENGDQQRQYYHCNQSIHGHTLVR